MIFIPTKEKSPINFTKPEIYTTYVENLWEICTIGDLMVNKLIKKIMFVIKRENKTKNIKSKIKRRAIKIKSKCLIISIGNLEKYTQIKKLTK